VNYQDVSISKTGTYGKEVFQTHRYGKDFTYTFSGLPKLSTMSVTMGFAETYNRACSGAEVRVFDIDVNGEEFATDLNVLEAAGGCRTSYVLTKQATVTAQGEITINFQALFDNAMVSFIEIDLYVKSGNGGTPSESEEEATGEKDETTTGLRAWFSGFLAWLRSLFSSIGI